MAFVLAFSLSGSVDQLSVIVSIAALVGVAVLALLAFAQARELKRLRDWAAKAGERAEEMERTIAARLRSAPPAQAVRQPAVQGRPVTPRTTPVVQRPVSAATAAATAEATQVAPVASALAVTPTAAGTAVAGLPTAGGPTPAVAEQPARSAVVEQPAAPAVADEPAQQKPSEAPAPVLAGAAVATGATIAAPGQAAGNGQPPEEAERRPSLPPAPTGEPRTPAGGPRTAAAASPRTAPRGATQAPRSAARQAGSGSGGGGGAPRGPDAAAPRGPGGAAGGRSVLDRKPTIYRRERSPARTIAFVVGGLVALAVVVVVVLSLTSSGGGAKPPASAHRGASRNGAAAAQSHRSLHVVVLNATETDGLAAKIASTLKGHGYKHATALFGTPAGSYPTTVVEYKPGRKAAASEVAKTLHIAKANVKSLASSTAPLAAGAPLVVIVGGPTATGESEGSEAATEGETEEGAAEGEASAGGETAEGGETSTEP